MTSPHREPAPSNPSTYAIRGDLSTAQRNVLDRLGRPGTWWTSAQLIAIAQTAREALADPERPPWGAVELTEPDLGTVATEVVWRLTNHPGTLTKDWHTSIISSFDCPEQYVELVATVAGIVALDRFSQALDLPPRQLPSPGPGEPTRQRIPEATVTTHWVPTDPEAAGANIMKALTSVPHAYRPLGELASAAYMPGESIRADPSWSRGALTRPQMELLAAKTSLVNECFY